MFQWETLTEGGPQHLQYQGKVVPGKVFRVELTSGSRIGVWRSDDCQQYFCHGLTFGGKEAVGGPVSPFTGKPVEVLLQEYYQLLPETWARTGDILVWRGLAPETTPHSGILTHVTLDPRKRILDDSASRIQTKNGLMPEMNMSLARLISIYGDAYTVYRKV